MIEASLEAQAFRTTILWTHITSTTVLLEPGVVEVSLEAEAVFAVISSLHGMESDYVSFLYLVILRSDIDCEVLYWSHSHEKHFAHGEV